MLYEFVKNMGAEYQTSYIPSASRQLENPLMCLGGQITYENNQ